MEAYYIFMHSEQIGNIYYSMIIRRSEVLALEKLFLDM